jgi:hypothetical protein
MAEDVAERGRLRQLEDLHPRLAAAFEDDDPWPISRGAPFPVLRPGWRFEVIVSTHCVPLLEEKQNTCLSLLLGSQLLA